MLARPQGREAEKAAGLSILEFYVCEYLRDIPKHLPIEGKKALRQCCKKLKALFDDTVRTVEIEWSATEIEFSSPFNPAGGLFGFRTSSRLDSIIPASLKSIDSVCRSFLSLERLRFWGHGINISEVVVPESLAQLKYITYLDLCHDHRYSMPNSFSNLTNLNKLTVGVSDIDTIAPALKHFARMETLYLEIDIISPTQEYPFDFLEGMTALNSLQLQVVGSYACFSPVRSLPNNIGKLKHLQTCMLNVRYLKRLPDSFWDLKTLKNVVLREFGAIKVFPDSIGQLTSLEELSIESFVNLESLPSSLSNLKSLREFTVEECPRLSALPSSMGDLQALTKLDVDYCNALTSLPESLGNLTSLEYLSVGSESLLSLPESLTGLTKLRSVAIWSESLNIGGVADLEDYFAFHAD